MAFKDWLNNLFNPSSRGTSNDDDDFTSNIIGRSAGSGTSSLRNAVTGDGLSARDEQKGSNTSGISGFLSQLGGLNLGSALVNWLNAQSGAALTNAQKEQNAWTLEQENTAYQRQVADMIAAGVNPALMYGGTGASGASSSSGSSVSVGSGLSSFLTQLMQNKLQEKITDKTTQTSKEIAETNANATIKSAEIAAEAQLQNAETNRMTAVQSIKESEARIHQIAATIKQATADAKLKVSQAEVNETIKRLNSINAHQAEALLPYQQAYLSAQTESAQAVAAVNMVKKMTDEKLLDIGYVQALYGEINARAHAQLKQADAASLNAAVNEGRMLTTHDEETLPSGAAGLLNTVLGVVVGATTKSPAAAAATK